MAGAARAKPRRGVRAGRPSRGGPGRCADRAVGREAGPRPWRHRHGRGLRPRAGRAGGLGAHVGPRRAGLLVRPEAGRAGGRGRAGVPPVQRGGDPGVRGPGPGGTGPAGARAARRPRTRLHQRGQLGYPVLRPGRRPGHPPGTGVPADELDHVPRRRGRGVRRRGAGHRLAPADLDHRGGGDPAGAAGRRPAGQPPGAAAGAVDLLPVPGRTAALHVLPGPGRDGGPRRAGRPARAARVPVRSDRGVDPAGDRGDHGPPAGGAPRPGRRRAAA